MFIKNKNTKIKLILYIFIAIIVYFTVNTSVSAQTMEEKNAFKRLQYGFLGSFDIRQSFVDFKALPECFSCNPGFDNGKGWGLGFGGFGELPFSNEHYIQLRCGIAFASDEYRKSDYFPYNDDGVMTTGTFDYILKTRLTTIFADLVYGYRPEFIFGMSVFGGLQFDFPLFSKYDQWEEVVDPSWGAFENGTTKRNEYSNQDIKDVSVGVSALGGLSYEIPLNEHRTIRLAPEVAFKYRFNPVVSGYSWNIFSFNAGAALKFSKYTEYPITVEASVDDSIVIDYYTTCQGNWLTISPEVIPIKTFARAAAGLNRWTFTMSNQGKELHSFSGITDSLPEFSFLVKEDSSLITKMDGEIECRFDVLDNDAKKEIRKLRIPIIKRYHGLTLAHQIKSTDRKSVPAKGSPSFQIEKTLSIYILPLLQCIFFDPNSSEIPKRYTRYEDSKLALLSKKKFDTKEILADYYDILNIIGKKMTDNDKITITVEGCNAGDFLENRDTSLARARAVAVKNYLTSVWKVEPKRIKAIVNVQRKGLPRIPSMPRGEENEEDASLENMRVEISSDALFGDVSSFFVIPDTTYSFNNAGLAIEPQLYSDSDIAEWTINIYKNGRILKTVSNNKNMPKTIIIPLENEIPFIARDNSPLKYDLFVKNQSGYECKASAEVPVSVTIKDSATNLNCLALYNFESSTLNNINKNIIDYVKSLLTERTQVSITGYTDRFGGRYLNNMLSKNRALSAASYMFDVDLSEDMTEKEARFGSSDVITEKWIKYKIGKNNLNINLTVKGLGKAEPFLFDNSIPEGRFYSRSVILQATIPIK